LGHDTVSVVEIGLSGADDPDVRAAAIGQDRILVTLEADFANVLRYPPAGTLDVVRLRLHPATEEAIDAMLRSAIPRLADLSVSGKLVVVGERKIRICVIHCRSGMRSAKACAVLKQNGFQHVRNVVGGILAWADKVDPSMPKY
jgi:rhodanese-related sulfurtransferase